MKASRIDRIRPRLHSSKSSSCLMVSPEAIDFARMRPSSRRRTLLYLFIFSIISFYLIYNNYFPFNFFSSSSSPTSSPSNQLHIVLLPDERSLKILSEINRSNTNFDPQLLNAVNEAFAKIKAEQQQVQAVQSTTTTPSITTPSLPITTPSLPTPIATTTADDPTIHHRHLHEQFNLDHLPSTENDIQLAQRLAVYRISGRAGAFQPFEYLIEPKTCINDEKKRIIIYVMVGSNAEQYTYRKVIRQEWANDARNRSIEVVFAMGRNKLTMDTNGTLDVVAARWENEQFGDVLMFNMEDSWKHLIHKWWATAHYHSSHCSHITEMVYADSDTVIFPENFEIFLNKYAINYAINTVGCQIMEGQPAIRDPLSRYFVSVDQWPNALLPPYCSGVLQMFSTEVNNSPYKIEAVQVAGKIARAVTELGIEYVLSFKIFDVVTGPVAAMSGVDLMSMPGLFPWLPVPDVCSPLMWALHGIKPAPVIASFFNYRRKCCAIAGNVCPYNGLTMPVNITVGTSVKPLLIEAMFRYTLKSGKG